MLLGVENANKQASWQYLLSLLSKRNSLGFFFFFSFSKTKGPQPISAFSSKRRVKDAYVLSHTFWSLMVLPKKSLKEFFPSLQSILRSNFKNSVVETAGRLLPFFPLFFPLSFFSSLTVSCGPNWFQTHYITEDDLELLTRLLSLSKSWDYRLAPPSPMYVMLGLNPGLLACSVSTVPTELSPQPLPLLTQVVGSYKLPAFFFPLRKTDFSGKQQCANIKGSSSPLKIRVVQRQNPSETLMKVL